MSRIASLPSISASHWEVRTPAVDGETFPTGADRRLLGGQPSSRPQLLTWAAQLLSRAVYPSKVAARGVLPRQLRPYRVEADESFFEVAHCPRCGADRGVFRRRFPSGLVCLDCWALLS